MECAHGSLLGIPHPWQSATKEERQRYSSYQRKATQICVQFYGSNDMWVHACVRACVR